MTLRILPHVAALPPYRQGKPAPEGGFKLSSNENHWNPLPGVLEALAAASEIHRYPDATAAHLRHALAARIGCTAEQVHIGSGSVAILAQIILATSGPGDEVLYAWRSFEAYPLLVNTAGATSVRVPLLSDGRHDLTAMAAAVTDATSLIILCSPNNPTGPAITRAEFEEFMAHIPNDRIVVLDEAYAEFVDEPDAVDGLDVVGNHPNLMVLRTFSKAYGLAGLRVGYAIADETILDAARATAIPLSVTAQAEAAALASLEHATELTDRVRDIAARRDRCAADLRAAGWNIPPAQGNFVWLPTGDRTDAVAEALFAAGVVARPFSGEGIRLSIGEPEAVDRAVAVLTPLAHP
ncbi:MAG TPA: histidinol-phosphate transaminase [Microbacteriaceae bacterium]|nr:histidinol-phosphate transaminase [Microbacteriaceae bacterium]